MWKQLHTLSFQKRRHCSAQKCSCREVSKWLPQASILDRQPPQCDEVKAVWRQYWQKAIKKKLLSKEGWSSLCKHQHCLQRHLQGCGMEQATAHLQRHYIFPVEMLGLIWVNPQWSYKGESVSVSGMEKGSKSECVCVCVCVYIYIFIINIYIYIYI